MPLKFTIKKIILSIIPFSFIHYIKKRASIDYLMFGSSRKHTGRYLYNNSSSMFTLYGMEDQLGEKVVKGFESCYKTYLSHNGLLRKYILEVEDCIIEPRYGWGISAKENKLVFDSISNNSWIETYHPSYFDYKKNRSSAIEYPQIISINTLQGGDKNYWHFMHDLLGEVALAKKLLPGNIPFLISKTLAQQSFFKNALEQSEFLSACTWVVRDDKYYKAARAYFLQTLPNSNEQFFDVRNILSIPDSDNSKQRKIFLKRNRKRIRFLDNTDEIEAIAKKYGFEIVDSDNLTLQQQIKLFGETKYLVGIHGAGLTNVLFRKNAAMHLLELLPADYLQPHYFWISKGMGHNYSCLVGSPSAYDTSFHIDASEFEKKLTQISGLGS